MSKDSEITLLLRVKQVAHIVIRRWWLLLICVGVTVSAAYLFLRSQTPVYRATAKVVVSQRPPRVMTGVQEVTEVVDGTTRRYREYITTQLDVIRSYRVAAEVLDRLDLWNNPDLFDEAGNDSDKLTRKELELKRSAELASRIEAKDVPDSMIVEISFESASPELAAKVATTAAEVYRDQNLEQKKKITGDAGVGLAAALKKRLKEKDGAQGALDEFEASQNIGTLVTRRKEVTETLVLFNNKLREATANRIALHAEWQQIQAAKKRSVLGRAAPQLLENPVITELKLRYIRKQTDVTALAESHGRKHPKMIAARRQVGKLRTALRREISAILRSVNVRYKQAVVLEAGLAEQVAAAKKRDDALATHETRYQRMIKKLKQTEEEYEKVRKRLKETRLSRDVATNNIRVLNPALVPKEPIRPKRSLTLALAGMLGIIIGILLALLLETADTTIRGKAHVEEIVDAPCLGLIPNITVPGPMTQEEHRRQRDLYVHFRPTSEAAEMGRTLRTNLLFVSAERKLKTLLITSPLPQEGKTTVAIQTAIALAAAGGKTLLVEADMRRPRVEDSFALEVDTGLSLYLANEKLKISDVSFETEVPNLDVIVCGPIPPNPAELLNSARLDSLIEEASEKYDSILFDSPPVNAVADALIVTSRIDGVLLVAKCGRTTTEAIRHAHEALESVNAPLVGLVLNDMREAHFGYYGSRYYKKRYYRYGTDSGDQDDKKRSLEVVKS
jgi:succinoglycan biosynthesis transport protein ExoP